MRLAHPGGNLTGVNIDAEFEIVAKRLQILKDVHQILNGAKPGDIPIYQPNKFRRIINLKAASALGLDPPSTLVARADGGNRIGVSSPRPRCFTCSDSKRRQTLTFLATIQIDAGVMKTLAFIAVLALLTISGAAYTDQLFTGDQHKIQGAD